MPARARRSCSPSRDATADFQTEWVRAYQEDQQRLREEMTRVFCEEQEALRVKKQRDRDEQRRCSQEMSRLLDTVQGMAVDLVRLGRRIVEVKIPALTSEPRQYHHHLSIHLYLPLYQ